MSTLLAKLTYNLVAYPLLAVVAWIAALFSGKLRKGLRGRRIVTTRAREFRAKQHDAKVVLFHCASAGELEGVKPLAAECRARGYVPCVSYFSPSAEAALRGDDFAFAGYSPFDSARSVRAFYAALRPDVVLISKHDVWPNLVWQANVTGAPIWLINGNFHAASFKLLPFVDAFHRAVYSCLTGVLTVSDDDAERATRITGRGDIVQAIGDTRFDRVLMRAKEGRRPIPEAHDSLKERELLICGSTHNSDDDLLIAALPMLREIRPNLQLLVVPHDPSDGALAQFAEKATAKGLSVAECGAEPADADILFVNRSGILADMYAYGKTAYVGGGFDRGIHSVIEPMAHGLRVLCGPNIGVSREANEARAEGLLFVVENAEELKAAFHGFQAVRDRESVLSFVRNRSGVVDRMMNIVLPKHGTA